MTLDPPGQLQFEEQGGDRGGCQLALAHQFVNRDRRRAQSFEDHVERILIGGGLVAAGSPAPPVGAIGGQLSPAGNGNGVSGGGGGAPRSSGPSCASTSSAVSVKVAPRRRRSLAPRQRGSSGEPGTAKTSRPCSSAKRAVISEPERAAASTTTTPSAIPEMIRLRRGKWRACGSLPSGNSATIAPCRRKRLVEPAVLLGIDDIDAAGDDRDGAGRERAQMRGGVDAAGEPGDDDEPALAERGGELAGEAPAIGRGVARADHRHHRPLEPLGPAEHAQHRRGILDLGERIRIGGLAPAHEAGAEAMRARPSSASAAARVAAVTVRLRSLRRARRGSASSAARAEPNRRSIA